MDLVKAEQVIFGDVVGKPVFKVASLVTHPQRELNRITNLIKEAQNSTKKSLQMLESQFQSGQMLYNDFLAKH